MNIIVLAIVSVAVIALVCSVMLVIASNVMAVKEDPLFPAVRECLPGANCGACGYAGCDGYAKALAAGTDKRTALITLLEKARDGVQGKTGTHIQA